jgi:hypothetical protein
MLLCCCFLFTRAQSQSSAKYKYLIVRINIAFDNDTEKNYYRIDAEPNNHISNGVNALVKYNTRLKTKNTVNFYPNNDTAKAMFNYFSSISEALQFLDENDWQVFSIQTVIIGSANSINSQPVYYLRSEQPIKPKQ